MVFFGLNTWYDGVLIFFANSVDLLLISFPRSSISSPNFSVGCRKLSRSFLWKNHLFLFGSLSELIAKQPFTLYNIFFVEMRLPQLGLWNLVWAMPECSGTFMVMLWRDIWPIHIVLQWREWRRVKLRDETCRYVYPWDNNRPSAFYFGEAPEDIVGVGKVAYVRKPLTQRVLSQE